jgi:hypothetical protein
LILTEYRKRTGHRVLSFHRGVAEKETRLDKPAPVGVMVSVAPS